MDYAAAVLPHESTRMSPFMVKHRYKPYMSFDWSSSKPGRTPKERLDRDEAQQLAKHMEAVWKEARDNMERAQERQAHQANKHQRPVD